MGIMHVRYSVWPPATRQEADQITDAHTHRPNRPDPVGWGWDSTHFPARFLFGCKIRADRAKDRLRVHITDGFSPPTLPLQFLRPMVVSGCNPQVRNGLRTPHALPSTEKRSGTDRIHLPIQTGLRPGCFRMELQGRVGGRSSGGRRRSWSG
jgi:hypothetical protein